MNDPNRSTPDPDEVAGAPGQDANPADPADRASTPAAHRPEKVAEAPAEDPLRGSGASRTWAALIALGVLLVVVVAFVAQNTESVPVNLFGWTWNPPLAAALLAAVALGLSIALIAGSMRILQLRRRVRRNLKG